MESRRRLKILRSFIAVSVQPKRTVRDNSVVCCQPEISAIRQRALVVRSNSFIPRGMRDQWEIHIDGNQRKTTVREPTDTGTASVSARTRTAFSGC